MVLEVFGECLARSLPRLMTATSLDVVYLIRGIVAAFKTDCFCQVETWSALRRLADIDGVGVILFLKARLEGLSHSFVGLWLLGIW
jgi:hypothetical protein